MSAISNRVRVYAWFSRGPAGECFESPLMTWGMLNIFLRLKPGDFQEGKAQLD